MKTNNRKVLASVLTGNSAALKEYSKELDACFILLRRRGRRTIKQSVKKGEP
jgi:hypothetical protein